MILNTPEKVKKMEDIAQSYVDQKNQEREFKKTSGKIYSKLINLHLSEYDARKWYFSENKYLDNKTPYDMCKAKKYDLVLKVAKDEISRLEWIINS